VVTFWDLGQVAAVWFLQFHPNPATGMVDRCYLDYLEAEHADFSLLAVELSKLARTRGYRYHEHVFPLDGGVVMGMTDTMKAYAEAAGIEPVSIMPGQVLFQEQVTIGVAGMPHCYFDAERTLLGRQRIANWRREFNGRTNQFEAKALKDMASHGADAAVLAMRYDPSALPMIGQGPPPKPPSSGSRGLVARMLGKDMIKARQDERDVVLRTADGVEIIPGTVKS
jgi:hypothetical protein